MAIIGLLATAAIPALNAIASAYGARGCAHEIAGLLELARSEAVARQTYVWVGFSVTNRTGVDEIVAGAVFSKDGSGTNIVANNLSSLFRPTWCGKADLIGWQDLTALTKGNSSNATPAGVETNASGMSFSVGQTSFQQKTIGFTPRGEAILAGSISPDTGFDPLISVSIRQSRGRGIADSGPEAAVLLDGASGAVRIIGL